MTTTTYRDNDEIGFHRVVFPRIRIDATIRKHRSQTSLPATVRLPLEPGLCSISMRSGDPEHAVRVRGHRSPSTRVPPLERVEAEPPPLRHLVILRRASQTRAAVVLRRTVRPRSEPLQLRRVRSMVRRRTPRDSGAVSWSHSVVTTDRKGVPAGKAPARNLARRRSSSRAMAISSSASRVPK